ncbi:MAG: hypothetical protein EOM15_01730 [Spirochaetia bacterium]|nr:hypothetical protein [Spirochaetia bacterium]
MKHASTIILFLFLLKGLFAFDFFFAQEVDKRTISFQSETSLTLYQDAEIESQATFTFALEQEKPLYRMIAKVTYDGHKQQLSTEALSLSLFLGSVHLKGGIFTHPWGSATLMHSVDILNAQDLRNGILDDLEAMKRPEAMISLSFYGETGTLDLILKPGFTPTYLQKEGRYALLPAQFATATLQEMNTNTLKNIGGGARYTIRHRWLDIGLLYFNGYNPQPGFENIVFDPNTFAPTGVDLIYTRYELFGIQSNMVKGPWNLALEGGFFLSEDREGTDLGRYNSKWTYLAEISYTDEKTNAFYALAYQGHYILAFPSNPLAVDMMASYGGKPYANTVAMAFEIPLKREKVTLRLGGTYQIESKGYVLLGSVAYAISDDIELFTKGTLYGSASNIDSLYKSWKDNDSLTIGLKAWF